MANLRLKSQILEVVENQIKANDPKCTKQTLTRLVDLGYSNSESKEMIARVLIEEMHYIMTNNEQFNEKRYSKKLARLPEYSGTSENEEKNQQIKVAATIGRNDPCPCSSGKKYKKCCGK